MERLKDIHLPGAIPPEPGLDWLMIVVVAVSSLLMLLAFARRLRLPKWKRDALARLKAAASRPAGDAITEIAGLVRSLAIRLDPTGEAARKTGDAYLHHLDRVFGTRFFTEGAGTVLGNALYRPAPDQSVPQLAAGLERVIRTMRQRT